MSLQVTEKTLLLCLKNATPLFSAVLMDIVMPRQDGLETLRQVHSLYPDLPVIMVSGASSPLNVVEAMRCGATDFLGKPVNYEELRKVVKLAARIQSCESAECDGKKTADPSDENVYLSVNKRRVRFSR